MEKLNYNIKYKCKVMSVYLRKKDRIYSQKSTRDNYINVFFYKTLLHAI